MPLRRPLALVVVWTAGALVATGTGVLAVRQVADRVSDPAPAPLSPGGVETALAEASLTRTPSATPVESASPTAVPATPAPPTATSQPVASPPSSPAPPAATARSFANEGGSIGVACDGGLPRLVYVTPAQGWSVDDRREDAERVEVRFRSDDGDARLRVVCGPGGPVEDPSG